VLEIKCYGILIVLCLWLFNNWIFKESCFGKAKHISWPQNKFRGNEFKFVGRILFCWNEILKKKLLDKSYFVRTNFVSWERIFFVGTNVCFLETKSFFLGTNFYFLGTKFILWKRIYFISWERILTNNLIHLS
jgi:hypothetical protein